jgi:hypothetical protein
MDTIQEFKKLLSDKPIQELLAEQRTLNDKLGSLWVQKYMIETLIDINEVLAAIMTYSENIMTTITTDFKAHEPNYALYSVPNMLIAEQILCLRAQIDAIESGKIIIRPSSM